MRKNVMKKFVRNVSLIVLSALLTASSVLTGCGQTASGSKTENSQEKTADNQTTDKKTKAAPEIAGLTYERTLELEYATGFDVFYYEEGYVLIDVHDSAQYLAVPEGKEAPEGLDENIVVIPKSPSNIYLAATSAMALFDSLDCLDSIKMSGTQASGWYIENAAKAMEEGKIVFAGKYSEPDYEMLVDKGCDLAIESTMIAHAPKVKEMIEMLGIPVFIDRSSYENHPLGRTEWIKLYAALMGKDEEAETFFASQTSVIEELKDFKNTEKTVAFFYVSTDGTIVVRKTKDYIPKMIEIAGGKYAFDNLENTENESAAVSLTMEEFYATAVNADYLIYNSSIDSEIKSVDELIGKNELFADFKAVKEGNVWCTGKYLYQATDIVGNLIQDIHLMLTDGDEKDMTFLYKVE